MNTTTDAIVRLDDLTPQNLTGILRRRAEQAGDPRASDLTVESVTVEPLGVGQIADSHRLTLEFARADDGPRSLVAKSAAMDEGARGAAMSLGLYRREVGFYQDLSRDLGAATPQCFHAEINEAQDFVLLLEDLAPAAPIDQLDGCGQDIAAHIMDQAARFHAPRWADPALEHMEWLNISADWYATQGSMYPQLFAGFRERYADATDDSNFGPGDALVANLDRWYELQRRPWTIQHGDFRLDNILIDADNAARPVSVVDWQTALLAPGLVDIAYFLGTSMKIEDRRAHEEDLLRRYHGELLANGVEDYSWDDCWLDYRRFAFAGYLMTTSASMVATRTERGDKLFVTMLERAAAQIRDLDSTRLLTDS